MAISTADAALLLSRAGFGGTAAEVASLAASADRSAAVDKVLTGMSAYGGPAMVDMSDASGLGDYDRFVRLQQWWVDRMANTTNPIVEKMTLFWHGLFTTSYSKVFDAPLIGQQHQYYRSMAMGNLQQFALGMALQPAMLEYLDNSRSTKRSPNQNFARELMELFLLGVGNYTEADVDAAARAFTGHTVAGGAYSFRSDLHDVDSKTLLGQTGNWDAADVITILFSTGHTPAGAPTSGVVAAWVATKLWEFFASPAVDANAVNAVAASLVADWNITNALKVLFKRSEFYATASVQGHVRSPVEYIVAVLRALRDLSVFAADVHPEWYFDAMGQTPFNPPSVEGWKHNGYWVSTASSGAKASFLNYITNVLQNRGIHPFATSTATNDVTVVAQQAFDRFSVSPSTASLNNATAWLTTQRALGNSNSWFERHGLFMLVGLCPELQIG